MKEATLESLGGNIGGLVEDAQQERILLTRNGKPVALVLGLENYDAEDWEYMTSSAFWQMIRERRKEPTVRLADIKEELLRDD